jgi:hypothetical protein
MFFSVKEIKKLGINCLGSEEALHSVPLGVSKEIIVF